MNLKTPTVWTVREVAAWCGVSVRTVLNWITRGELPSYKLPGRGDNRIRNDDLTQFLVRYKMPVPRPERGLSKGRVMVVEDDGPTATLICKMLEREGYETAIARDGFSAGTLMASFRPDLITMDLRMPGLQGAQVIRMIRSMPEQRHLRILVVSGMAPEDLEDAVRAGADDSYAKPVEFLPFMEKVHRLMARRV